MIEKSYALRCDGCGNTGPAFNSSREARQRYRAYGWRRVPASGDQAAGDRCTRCLRRAS